MSLSKIEIRLRNFEYSKRNTSKHSREVVHCRIKAPIFRVNLLQNVDQLMCQYSIHP